MSKDDQIDAMTAALVLVVELCADVNLNPFSLEVLRKGTEAFVELVCERSQP